MPSINMQDYNNYLFDRKFDKGGFMKNYPTSSGYLMPKGKVKPIYGYPRMFGFYPNFFPMQSNVADKSVTYNNIPSTHFMH